MKLKHYFQKKKSSACGPVSLKIVFKYRGKTISAQELIKECKTTKGRGTSHKKMIEVSKKNGFKVKAKNKNSINDIIQNINEKNPVIVNYINPKSGRGHYSIIKDYNPKKEQLIFADPSNGNNFKMNFNDFNKRWFNKNKTSPQWMMVLKNQHR